MEAGRKRTKKSSDLLSFQRIMQSSSPKNLNKVKITL
jgi:hypothetical protein